MKSLTPLEDEDMVITDQICKVQHHVGAALCKYGLSKKGLQRVLENEAGTFISELELLVRRHIELNSDLVTRRIRPTSRTFADILKDINFRNSVSDFLTEAIDTTKPKFLVEDGEEIEIVFFSLGRKIRNEDELADEFESRGLLVAHPSAVAACFEAEPLPKDKVVWAIQPFLSPTPPHEQRIAAICFSQKENPCECYAATSKEIYEYGNEKWVWFAGMRKPA